MIDVVLGLQWGDEGKGKIVDVLTPQYDVVARFQGGPNAGHTLEFNGQKHVLNTIPSGIFHQNCINIIGNGVVIDPVTLKKEIEKMNTIVRDNFQADDDACNITNPLDILAWARQNNLDVISVSSQSVYSKSVVVKILDHFPLTLFFGACFFVFKKN